MLPLARPVLYPLCLLGGSLLVAVAAAAHPDLGGGDGAAQLAVIAHCESWRVIHWAFLFGFALSLTGLMGVSGAAGGLWQCGIRNAECGTEGAGSQRGSHVIRRSPFNSAFRTPHSAFVYSPSSVSPSGCSLSRSAILGCWRHR